MNLQNDTNRSYKKPKNKILYILRRRAIRRKSSVSYDVSFLKDCR